MINVRERDQVKQQRAYLGAVVQLGEKKEVIPFIQPGAAMEYELSSNIKKLSISNKPKLGFLQGYGIPSLASMQQLNQSLSVMYTVDTVSVTPVRSIPVDVNTLAVIAPKDTLDNYVFDYLDDFIQRGGRLLVAVNHVEGDLQAGSW